MKKLSFLALGDSYTIGESVEPGDRWPVQLAARLRAAGIDMSDPTILARTGWTSDELQHAMDDAPLPKTSDLVGLLIGVNDEYRGYDAKGFQDHLDILLARAVKLAGGDASHVVVLAIPDWGVTPFGKQSGRSGVSGEIDQFNAIVKQRTEKAGAKWVDTTAVSREAGVDTTLVAEDGLHPSGKLYGKWAEIAEPVAAGIFGK